MVRNFISGNKYTNKSTGDKIIEFYIIVIFTFYSFFLMEGEIFGIEIKTILYFTITVITTFIYITAFLMKKAYIRKPCNIMDYGILVYGSWNVIIIIMKFCIANSDIERNILSIALILSYYVVSCGAYFHKVYLDYLLASGLIIFGILIVYYLGSDSVAGLLSLLYQNAQMEAGYILLICMMAILRYCSMNQGENEIKYYILCSTGFSLLFINGHIIGCSVIVLIFILIPLVFTLTEELIKRNMICCFIFFFTLSTLGLLSGTVFRNTVDVEITGSIYIDIFIILTAVLYYVYWNIYPQKKGITKDRIKFIHKMFTWLLSGFIGIAFVIMLAGNKLEHMYKNKGIEIINRWFNQIQNHYLQENGSFYDTLMQFGVYGFILVIFLWVYAVRMVLSKKVKTDKEGILKIIGICFLIQFAFFSSNSLSTPVYVIVFSLLLYGKNEQCEK